MARGRQLPKTNKVENGITMAQAAEEFNTHNTIKGLSAASMRVYTNYVSMIVSWCGEDAPIAKMDAKRFEAFLKHKKDEGLKDVSVATTAKHLRRFFNFCISRNYLEEFEIIIPKFEVEQKEPYTDEEMKLLLKKPTSGNWVEFRNWTMINYFYGTGQRLSTVLNIKVEHLDLNNNKVWLEWNKDKIKKWMPLSSAVVKVLREYILASGLEEKDYLFPEYEGKQLKVSSAADAIADYNRARGVEKTSIHLFRHTFAKNYIMNGGSAAKLQKLLNHKTIDMTMKYVNLYSVDISSDLDLFNPLDNFKRNNHTPTKRKRIG